MEENPSILDKKWVHFYPVMRRIHLGKIIHEEPEQEFNFFDKDMDNILNLITNSEFRIY